MIAQLSPATTAASIPPGRRGDPAVTNLTLSPRCRRGDLAPQDRAPTRKTLGGVAPPTGNTPGDSTTQRDQVGAHGSNPAPARPGAAVRRRSGRLALLLWAALATVFGAGPAPAVEPARRPNLILILADDLGWADLGCYGNTYHETPQIDRLAREGARFTQFYAGPVCSPTRTNLQSGQDQARFGITQHIPGHRRPYARLLDPAVPLQLPLEVETFAERLAAAGYATGYFGKWHLGGAGFGPERQGWQTALECGGHTQPARVTGEAGERRTAGFLTDKAVAFIAANRARPFLLQVSHTVPHIPLTTTPELLARFSARPKVAGFPCNPAYAGLIAELDQSVGRIADAVDQAGLGRDTLILFVSDNGGLEHEQSGRIVTSNRPLRGEKGTLYEGGIRVPAIARWTGRIAAGRTIATPALTHDVHPTFLELGGASPAAGQPLDGVSLAPLLREPTQAPAPRPLFWHLPHYHHSTPASAIRQGDWKLIEFFEDHVAELYDLARDPGETTNLAARDPQRTRELRDTLAAWRQRVGARLPTANPDHDPARATELGQAGKARKNSRR